MGALRLRVVGRDGADAVAATATVEIGGHDYQVTLWGPAAWMASSGRDRPDDAIRLGDCWLRIAPRPHMGSPLSPGPSSSP